MKLVLFIVLAILSVFTFTYGKNWRRKHNIDRIAVGFKSIKANDAQGNPYNGLRKQAMEMTANALGLDFPDDKPAVYGIVMDIGMSQGVATLVAYKTGDASLYLSSGGGIIGGGKHVDVNQAAKLFVNAGQQFLKKAMKATNTALAAKDTVKFYLLTSRGVYLLVDEIKKLDNNSSPYNSLFTDGNLLLTRLRASGNL